MAAMPARRSLAASARAAFPRGALVAALSLGLASCDLSPDYHPQKFLYPDGWAGKGILGDGRPADGAVRPDWWKMFRDPVLNDLESRMLAANPDLEAAAEAFTQSRDVARESQASLYPQLAGSAGGSKNKESRSALWRSRSATTPVYESSELYSGAATWEPDFWSRIRNTTRMEKNLAQATAADYALTRLSLEAELASDYVALRGLDAQLAVYDDSIRYYQTAVEITRLRQAGAISAGLDVSRAENQLFSSQSARSIAVAQRRVMENALAVLVNAAPAAFHIERVRDVNMHLGAVPVAAGLPSTLLERRPDIAAAERRMAASARAIGVSRAAFYPNVTFSASGGFMNNGFDLASLSNSMWTYGVQALEPLFTGGLRRAALQRAWSQYRQSADEYRATVLDAFQDVENGLTESGQYLTAQHQQEQAVAAALRTQSMTMALYTGGLSNYLDALVAQQYALTARLSLVQTQTSQVQATVRLVRALGGGWSAGELPLIKQINPFGPLQYDNLRMPKPAGGIDPHPSEKDNDLRGNALVSENGTGENGTGENGAGGVNRGLTHR